jgi:hypothetical protein
MRFSTGILGLSVFGASLAWSAPAAADHDIGIFYEELAPHGDWVHSDHYGWVWTPAGVPPGWRPYTYGRWEYSDFGWTWVADEEWGWAPYHYGRWYRDPYYGWAWVPGTDWGPAWVAWREGDGYVGWAPLPPEAEWRADFGLSIGDFDLGVSLGSDAWTFVDEHRIIEPHIHRHVILPTSNVTIIRHAPIVTRTRYHYVDGHVINYGVPVERVERTIGRRIYRTPVRVVENTPHQHGSYVRYGDGGSLNIYRPQITRRTTTVEPRVYRTRDGVRIERSDGDDGNVVRRRTRVPQEQSPDARARRERTRDEAGEDARRREAETSRREDDRRREAQEDRAREDYRRKQAQEDKARKEAQERDKQKERSSRPVKKAKPRNDNDDD